jgi:enterochelin esterase-like enzyme
MGGGHMLYIAIPHLDDGLITTSKATVEFLNKHGFHAIFEESPGAHTWINWRNYLDEFAPKLFN